MLQEDRPSIVQVGGAEQFPFTAHVAVDDDVLITVDVQHDDLAAGEPREGMDVEVHPVGVTESLGLLLEREQFPALRWCSIIAPHGRQSTPTTRPGDAIHRRSGASRRAGGVDRGARTDVSR